MQHATQHTRDAQRNSAVRLLRTRDTLRQAKTLLWRYGLVIDPISEEFLQMIWDLEKQFKFVSFLKLCSDFIFPEYYKVLLKCVRRTL